MREYLHGVMPLLTGAGNRLVKRLKVAEVINGNASGMVLVMDFESPDIITGLFESDDDAALIPTRDRGFRELSIVVTHTIQRSTAPARRGGAGSDHRAFDSGRSRVLLVVRLAGWQRSHGVVTPRRSCCRPAVGSGCDDLAVRRT